VKALQVDENIAMKRNIKAQCYKWRCCT
jgi:hypothetical protein